MENHPPSTAVAEASPEKLYVRRCPRHRTH
jgi:hypothetical protein